MTEADMSRKLVEHLQRGLPGAVIFKHNDQVTAGIPDISLTWNGRTTWIEVKLVKESGVISRGIQQLRCLQLARQGSCVYVIFEQRSGDAWTTIRNPEHGLQVDDVNGVIDCAAGIKPEIVVEFIQRTHQEHACNAPTS
jgi:hypothetical protein